MDTVTILRELWRVRLLVAIVALIALLAGTAVVFKISFPPKLESRRYEVGVATARILVDTPSSQVVEVAPKGSDTLGVRANLLASLMVDGVIRSTIAQRAGLKPNQLIGTTDAATDQSGSSSTPTTRRSFVLKTQVLTNTAGDELPIIEIDAQAPDRAHAARLASAAVSGLSDYLNSKAALQRVPDADRLQIDGLGAPAATTAVRGPSTILGIVAAFLIFVLGCAGILGFLSLVRGWQAAAARDELGADEPLDWDEEDDDVVAADEPLVVEVPEPEPVETDDDAAWIIPPRPALVPPPGDEQLESDEADEPPARRAWGR
jgi:capsular polysaccharide biosynthesis protein